MSISWIGAACSLARHLFHHSRERLAGQLRSASRQGFHHGYRRAPARRGIDEELVHKAARADDSESHPCCRAVAALENRLYVRDTRAFVGNSNMESAVYRELNRATVCISKCVTGDFGDGSSDRGLFLGIKSEQTGDPPRLLARRNHILFGADADRQDRSSASLTHDQHCNVVSAAAEVPVERPSNDCGMLA